MITLKTPESTLAVGDLCGGFRLKEVGRKRHNYVSLLVYPHRLQDPHVSGHGSLPLPQFSPTKHKSVLESHMCAHLDIIYAPPASTWDQRT